MIAPTPVQCWPRGKHTHSLPGSRLLPVRWKDPLVSLCRQTLNRRAQCVKSPDLSHDLPSCVPRMDESSKRVTSGNAFWHLFLHISADSSSACTCRQEPLLPSGIRRGFGPEKAG